MKIFHGEFSNRATHDADYIINDKKVEITLSNNEVNKFFHQKTHKVDKYIKNNTYIVFVNGFLSKEEPDYIVITPQLLEIMTKKSYNLFGIVLQPTRDRVVNKPAYRYDISWFNEWRPLPKLHSKLPSQYKDIYKLLKK